MLELMTRIHGYARRNGLKSIIYGKNGTAFPHGRPELFLFS